MQYNLSEIVKTFNSPLQEPPPGITPNFDDPPTNAHATYIATGICAPTILVAVIFVVLDKITAKNYPINWGDGLFLLGAAGAISYITMTAIYVGDGPYSRHSWDVKVGDLSKQTIILVWMASWLYTVWMLIIKLSLLLLYLTIFGTKKWLRISTYGGIVVLVPCHIIACLVAIITCGPRGGASQLSWIAGISSSECTNGFKFGMFQSVMGLVGDIYLMLLPLPAVWSLQMTTKKKLGVTAMFATGLIAIVASSWMVYYRARILNGYDILWKVVYQGVASMSEMTSGILIRAMPSIASVTRRLCPVRFTRQRAPSVDRTVTYSHHYHPWLRDQETTSSKKRNNSSSTKRTSVTQVRHKKSDASSFWTSNEQLSQVRIWAATGSSAGGGSSTRTSDDSVGIRRTTEFSVETFEQVEPEGL